MGRRDPTPPAGCAPNGRPATRRVLRSTAATGPVTPYSERFGMTKANRGAARARGAPGSVRSAPRRLRAGAGLAELARPGPDRRLRRHRARVELVGRRGQPHLVPGVHRPFHSRRLRRPRLRQRPHGRRRLQEGDRHLLGRRGRDEAVGAHLQHPQHHGPLQPCRLGQRDRGSGDGLPLRDEHRRPPPLLQPRRSDRLELAARRGPRPGVGLRGADIDAHHRTRIASSSGSSARSGAISGDLRRIATSRSTRRTAASGGFPRPAAGPRT